MKLTFDFNFKFCYKLLLLFLLFNISTHSQSIEICGTADIFEPDPAGVYSRSSEPSYFDTFTPKTFDIFFWRINKNDGSYTQGGTPLTPERARA